MHLLFSIRASAVSIIVGIMLFLAVMHLSTFVESSSTGMALIIGTVTGILATLILNIGEKYSRSVHAYKALQYNGRKFYTWIKNERSQMATMQKEVRASYAFWQQHFQLCVQSEDILYRLDAEKITDAVSDVIDAIGFGFNELDKALEELDQALRYAVICAEIKIFLTKSWDTLSKRASQLCIIA